MATLLSPGVYIEEVDASHIVPNTSNNVAFFAGNFDRGPLEQPYVVTTLTDLEEVFGYPTDKNYNEWFQCSQYLNYADQLVISRGFEEFDLGADITYSDDKRQLFTTYDAEVTATTTSNTNDTIVITTTEKYAYVYGVGDWVSFDNSQIIYLVTAVATIPADISAGGTTPKLTELSLQTANGAEGIETVYAGTNVFLHSIRFLNGGTQALSVGPVSETGEPLEEKAISDLNVDYSDDALDSDLAPKRMSYQYDLIKNYEEWQYLTDSESDHSLETFMSDAKLKFFNKTANTDTVEIAIASMVDFQNVGGENYAIAFSETIGDNTENTYLTSLFGYYPTKDQIAIALKMDGKVEAFLVSFDEHAVDGNNRSNYIENVINEQSKLVYVLDNKALDTVPASYLVCDKYGWETSSDGDVNIGTPADGGQSTTNLLSKGGRSPKIGRGALRDAYFTVEDKEMFEIDVVIGNEFVEGDYDNQNYAIELADKRKDCVAFIGARYIDTVKKKSADATRNIISYITEVDPVARGLSVQPVRTMFAAFFANYLKVYDKYNKKSRFINCAGDTAGVRCQTSSAQDAWWVSAGVRRGVLKNIERLAFTPSQAQRDNLYKNGINPIVSFPGSGNLIWGNKTLHPLASSFDRINVRTLFNTIERAMAKAARSEVFEFNDPYTRNAILSMFNPYLATIKGGRGIVDYLVVCDESNNTPDVISRNELRVDIYVKPNYAAEMILLTFTNVGTRSFASVVGA